jgi:hypothetical protein
MSEGPIDHESDSVNNQYHMPSYVDHYKARLNTYRENLGVLLEQRITFGSYAPAHIIMQIRDIRREIQYLKITLHQSGYVVDDHPDDEESLTNISASAKAKAAELYSLGIQAHLQGKLWEAENYYQQAKELNPYHPGLKEKLFLLQREMRQTGSIFNDSSPLDSNYKNFSYSSIRIKVAIILAILIIIVVIAWLYLL